MKFLQISTWLITFIIVSNIIFDAINSSNTIENIIAAFSTAAFVFITIRTKFFTKIK